VVYWVVALCGDGWIPMFQRAMLPPSSSPTLKMEAAWPSPVLISNHHTIWCNNPEDHKFYLHHHENLKSWKQKIKESRLFHFWYHRRNNFFEQSKELHNMNTT
jgi:hypothetical protein